MKLELDQGGEGKRLCVFLHGLFATRQVWQPMLSDASRHWRGRWLAPDLRGHGASPHAASYAPRDHAADVAALVKQCGDVEQVVVMGHSMGGVVALALASGAFGFQPAAVFGLGIKVAWNEDELSRLQQMASAPVRVFATREEAISRHLKLAGLVGLTAPDSAIARAGVTQEAAGWRLAADPQTASVGAPAMRELLAAAACPVHLGRGETDPMVSDAQLRAYDPASTTLSNLGHNAMLEDPSRVWHWLRTHSDHEKSPRSSQRE